MRRRIFSFWSILLVLFISLAVLIPGCEGEGEECIGEIEVKATLCDAPWEGDVQYKLTGPGAAAPTVIDGTNVTALFDNVDCGNWTCEYVSGGPPGAYLVDITPDPTQEVTTGSTITFTLNFEQSIIEVEATLCDAPWEGDVQYTLTGPGAAAPTIINGTSVPNSHTGEAGNWTCGYVSGGPPGAFLVDITPDPTQEVTSCANITFTLNFELDQDAWIVESIDPWTLNGNPIPLVYDAFPCDIIDVHFGQGVNGCEGYQAAVSETSWLFIHLVSYTDNLLGPMPPNGPVQLYVVNDDCAVEKLPTPPEKVSQMTTFFDTYIPPGEFIELQVCEPVIVDVETIWTLVKEIDYTKSINWFGISMLPEFAPGLEHECVLFELIVPQSYFGAGGTYHFQLQASAQLELMDDEDVNPGNDDAVTPPLDLYVNVLY